MPDNKLYDQPSDVVAEDGRVIIRGPDAVDVDLTPDAAEETSNRMLEASLKARGQRYFSPDRKD